MPDYHYKSDAPATVAIVQEFYQAKNKLHEQLEALGNLFGGKVAPMHDITSHFAGGVKLSADRALDVHWRRPDEWGFRTLRNKAVPPKGIPKDERASIRAEHERLLTLWRDNCPPRLDSHAYWNRLTINTGNLLLCGGVMFEHQGIAYFHLGFQIDKAKHEANIAANKPTSGWIEGAVEILPSQYQTARQAKLEARQ
ncbi:hypothetical protein [Phytopseudomonas daroniae]|uniref:hypothetical protein n=1 Tax=Phytopseudomonas daroniae TaxID=2487519 RepID=UPI0010383686|nr:hypothetical protein [Pseudomonas daroniae]TBU78190.1 hypothetical protein DNK10_00125 [Pseudomonas daroniae]